MVRSKEKQQGGESSDSDLTDVTVSDEDELFKSTELLPVEFFNKELEYLQKLVNTITNAFVWSNIKVLGSCARVLHNLAVRRATLHVTGLASLIANKGIWLDLDANEQAEVHRTCMKWRKLLRTKDKEFMLGMEHVEGKKPAAVLGKVTPATFLARVREMTEVLQQYSGQAASVATTKWTAMQLVNKGVTEFVDLAQVTAEEITQWFAEGTPARILVTKLLPQAQRDADLRHRERLAEVRAVDSMLPSSVFDGSDIAQQLDPRQQAQESKERLQMLGGMGLTGLGTDLKPVAALEALRRAERLGHDVQGALKRQQDHTVLANRSGSMPATISAIRHWHTFATTILRYEEKASLPPRCEDDVIKWVLTFNNSGSAYNYVAAVHFICQKEGVATDWYSARVTQTIAGIKKLKQARVTGRLDEPCILTELIMERVTKLADAAGDEELSIINLTGWAFLLRMQSECFGLETGIPEELRQLPGGRHSGVVVELQSNPPTAHLRLMKRKNKPGGSWMQRPCECDERGDPDLCVVHRLGRWIQGRRRGHKIFPKYCNNPAAALKQLRFYLKMLRVAKAEFFTWKAYRAGKATALTAGGVSVLQTLKLGEWKGAAIMHYIHEDEVDAQRVINQVQSDDEDDK